jgi:hypothetical protein
MLSGRFGPNHRHSMVCKLGSELTSYAPFRILRHNSHSHAVGKGRHSDIQVEAGTVEGSGRVAVKHTVFVGEDANSIKAVWSQHEDNQIYLE